MPINRVHVEWSPVEYDHGLVVYPRGHAELQALNVIANDPDSRNPAERFSALAGIDEELLDGHPLIAFPCRFDWDQFRGGSHRDHVEFIRTLSAYVDRTCLNILKFNLCELGLPDTIPGRAGTVASNSMMAGALLYNQSQKEARLIGGSAFSHAPVMGLGLPLQSLPRRCFPRQGQTGRIASHALELFAVALEANTPTVQFVQAMSLLEFLADPYEFQKFEKVSKTISQYVAKDQVQYKELLDRFFVLTGKRSDSGEITGYRTQIVHLGKRLEDILLAPEARQSLLRELQGYIRCVIRHMIEHSEMVWDQYIEHRNLLDANLQNRQNQRKV